MTNPWFMPDLSLHPEGCPCNWCTVASGQPRPRVIHPKGCRCQGCADLRAAVGRGMDKQIARTMEAQVRGKTRAGQILIDQAHREGAARAEVTRELADCGIYPYRFSSGWHEPGCGCGCEKPGRKIPETTGQVYAEADARGADPVWQWQEVTRSIILPDYGQRITAIPDQPPGTCKDCRTGPLFKGNQCWYCNALGDMAITPVRQPVRRERSFNPGALLFLITLTVLFWTALVLILVLT